MSLIFVLVLSSVLLWSSMLLRKCFNMYELDDVHVDSI